MSYHLANSGSYCLRGGRIIVPSYQRMCPGLERFLQATPGEFKCERCGGEVEIWSNESGASCASCGAWVERREEGAGARKRGQIKVEVMELSDDFGETIIYERYETEIAVSAFDHGDRFKIGCEACGRYGKNLACPPFSPSFRDYVDVNRAARVICIRIPQGQFANAIPEEQYRACFRKAKEILTSELLEARRLGLVVAGSGPCLLCEECRIDGGGDACRNPGELIYSLESLGVNLVGLAGKCFEMHFEWESKEGSADFICAMGAIFSSCRSELGAYLGGAGM